MTGVRANGQKAAGSLLWSFLYTGDVDAKGCALFDSEFERASRHEPCDCIPYSGRMCTATNLTRNRPRMTPVSKFGQTRIGTDSRFQNFKTTPYRFDTEP